MSGPVPLTADATVASCITRVMHLSGGVQGWWQAVGPWGAKQAGAARRKPAALELALLLAAGHQAQSGARPGQDCSTHVGRPIPLAAATSLLYQLQNRRGACKMRGHDTDLRGRQRSEAKGEREDKVAASKAPVS